MDPEGKQPDRSELIRMIHAAFKGVTREGGMSWSDAWEADGGPASDCPLYPDRDRNWTELIDDERWHPSSGWGGFSFLDAVGFRYYLPVALVRCVRDRADCGIVSHLRHSLHKSGRIEKDPRKQLLSNAQLRCIVAVATYMAAIAFDSDDDWSLDDWTRAIEHITPAIQGPT